MEIVINYSSKWGNSFLSAPQEVSPEDFNNGKHVNIHEGRSYIASLSNMNSGKNKDNALDAYKQRGISLDTVTGVIYRLIGARQSLAKMKLCDKSIISELNNKNSIRFSVDEIETDELVYLRNNSLNTDQNSYSGVPNADFLEDPDIQKAVSVVFMSSEQLKNLIINNEYCDVNEKITDIIELANKLSGIYSDKKNYAVDEECYQSINDSYQPIFGMGVDEKANLVLLAINKTMKSVSESEKGHLVNRFLTKNGTFSGVSMNGKTFTFKDFMKKFAQSKFVYGNPYQTDFWVKRPDNPEKNTKFNKKLTKSTGVLRIFIDCSGDEAAEIAGMIECAGVSSFYLGKKGLAYISEIII